MHDADALMFPDIQKIMSSLMAASLVAAQNVSSDRMCLKAARHDVVGVVRARAVEGNAADRRPGVALLRITR